MIFPPDPAEAGLEVLDFAPGQGRAGGSQTGFADLGTARSHQVDGRISHLWGPTITRAAQRQGDKAAFLAAVPPICQGATRDTELLSGVLVLQPTLDC
jgi:hypothetical protein